jgi:hypothetical protein
VTEREAAGASEMPLFSVVSGNPTEEEIAALTVVLMARAAAQDAGGGGRRSGERVSTAWNQPSRRMRPVVRRGYRAWRRNALPH